MAVTLTDKIVFKRLTAVGNNTFFYEGTGVSAGTMTELTTTGLAVDTSDQLEIASAYQKVFVANGAKLYVADFINSKIATAAIGATVPVRNEVLTGQSSGATMVVDFITASSSACTVYGYRTSTATFTASENIHGTACTEFNMTATAEVASPHWYAWTPYANNTTTYGSMPSKAYLVCVYRGRLVLAGHPDYPYRWWMSRVGNPWDWLYVDNDPLSPVSGNTGEVGEVGDMMRCLIPIRDDYLVMGKASNVSLLRGDPCSAGSMDLLTSASGIFGARSFCFDADSTLYFMGEGGIYSLSRDFGELKCISILPLPNLIKDEDIDTSVHRITMAYDREREGLFISITTLADGHNSCYWYDLRTQGFFPESYPHENGCYSSFYYDANDKDYSGMLIGCKDGYIRVHGNTTKSDNTGTGSSAISSYMTLPILSLSDNLSKEGKLTSLTFDLAGGASSGTFSDTDQVDYAIYSGPDAETVLEDIKDGATAQTSGTLSGTGRQNKIRDRVRGTYLALRLSNSTAAKTWALNRVSATIEPYQGQETNKEVT